MSPQIDPISIETQRVLKSINRSKSTFGSWLYYVRLRFSTYDYYKVGISGQFNLNNRFRSYEGLWGWDKLGLWAFSVYDKDKARKAERQILEAFSHHRLLGDEMRGLPSGRTEFFRMDIWQSYGLLLGQRYKGYPLFKTLVETSGGKLIFPPQDVNC